MLTRKLFDSVLGKTRSGTASGCTRNGSISSRVWTYCYVDPFGNLEVWSGPVCTYFLGRPVRELGSLERSSMYLLSRWTHSGTASGCVWNCSISSRANERPICVYLGTVPFGTVPVLMGP